MSIKFPDLLQDSWNFIRNQRAFSITSLVCLIVLQVANMMLLPKITLNEASEALSLVSIFPTLIIAILNIFLTTLFILNIKDINNGQFSHFFKNTSKAFVKLFSVIGLNILMVLPLSIGMSFVAMGSLANSGSMLIALPLLISGVFIFMKLCLASYAYLIEELKNAGESVRFIWALSRGKTFVLFLYCLIAYFVPQILTAFLSGASGNFAGVALLIIVSAFLSLFVTVFSFRFYQMFRQNSEVSA